MSTRAASTPTAPSPSEVWSSGNYADVADRMIPELGARLVELAGVREGERVLDVAAGAGNAALPAARAGASVTALDITPALLEAGAQRASAAGLEIAWVHGNAEALPFADASFDRVISCVGVQFCADHRAAAAELLRVCRPDGSVALIAWTPEGFIGQVLRAVSKAMGTAGAAHSPLTWGSEAGLHELLGGASDRAVVCREQVEMSAPSAAEWVDYMADAYGPLVRARAALDPSGAWEALREDLVGIATAHDGGGDAGFVARAEYLGALIR
jgi:ubiquinone/menaquinone biosynthesis C-methylase UbiE